MSTQIVFLIDTDLDEQLKSDIPLFSNSICLSCFRLLHYLSSHFEKRGAHNSSKSYQTSVKWGYKFFNSQTSRTRIESHKLYDFKLKYFEEFESEIQQRLENNSLLKIPQQYKPSNCLSKALTELLSDFQWENPDITSPVKGRKHKREVSTRTNLVFLFSKCPKNSAQLKAFSGKQVPHEDVFLDALLPPSLLQQFCYVSKLSLNWIDTQPLNPDCLDGVDLSSVLIIERAISKAGGNLFPLSALVQNGSPYFIDLRHLTVRDDDSSITQEVEQNKGNDGKSSGHLLSITTRLGHLLSLNNSLKDTKINTSGSFSLEVCGHVISVSLTPVSGFNENVARKSCNTVDIPSSMLPIGYIRTKTSSIRETSPQMVWTAYGIIQRQTAGMNIKADFHYTCTESLKESGGKKEKFSKNGLFEKLISSLTVQESILVLISKITGQLATLEPLTVHAGSFSILTMDCSLQMEKGLMVDSSDSVVEKKVKRSSDELIQRLVTTKQVSQVVVDQHVESSFLDGSLMERWHIPGPSSSLDSLITKLNQRIGELDFLSPDETSVLKQLQKSYKQANKPPGLRDTSVLNTAEPQIDEVDKFELPFKGKKSRTSISRTDMIMMKSKAMVKERGQSEKDDGEMGKDKQDRERPEIAIHLSDFKNEEELKQYLSSTYDKVVTGEISGVDSNVQMMVTVALHYMKQTGTQDPQQSCAALVEESLLVSGAKLREKYNNKQNAGSPEHKITEYQFQVVLRLEILSTLVSKDQTMGEEDANEEIVSLLRTLSFVLEPGLLSKFMQSCLIYNYMHTIPKTLANIYDELMQPLPDVLANLLSPDNSSADQSVLDSSFTNNHDNVGGPPSARTRSHGSVGPASSQPSSNKSLILDTSIGRQRGGRKLVHHPSLADFGAKRQIVVEKKAKPKEKSQKKGSKDSSRKRSRDKVTKALFDKGKGGCKLERRQSVAIMESSRKTPKKSRSKHLLKSPVNRFTSPRRKIVAETPKRVTVADTPCHKQVSKALKQDENLRRHSIATDITTEVVEESPVKACESRTQCTKDTPTKGKKAKALLRRSFYSAGPIKRNRNLTQYFQLADKIAGRKKHPSGSTVDKLPKLLTFEVPAQFKSPDKKRSSFLMSQLVSSPSPVKVTPRKSARTPSKFLAESPSLHTRSKCPSPSLNMLLSPSRQRRAQTFTSPSSRRLLSPLSRRQSPRVLVAESETKMLNKSPHKTPEKSPICGVVSFGLDSPSQNTRQKVTSATPTRKSVRAALFARSPAASKYQSPRRGNASPQTLLSRFASPQKQTTIDAPIYMSPRKISLNEKCLNTTPKKLVINEVLPTRSSPRRFPKMESSSQSQQQSNLFGSNKETRVLKPSGELSNTNLLPIYGTNILCGLQCDDLKTNTSSSLTQKLNFSTVPKTPSPHRKKITKTPDSFDKWHRRKPRSTQNSPALKKTTHQADIGPAVISPSDRIDKGLQPESATDYSNLKSMKSDVHRKLYGSNVMKSPLSKKRSLILSPEKSQGSPSKRRRTDVGRTRVSSLCQGSSQGFEVTSSFRNLSQESNTSSLDYFSSLNDEVFLSQSQHSQNDHSDMEVDDIENKMSASLSQGRSSPRNKKFEKLCSDYLPFLERPESPIFGISRKSDRVRNFSGETSKLVQNIENMNRNKNSPNSGNSTKNSSPKILRSPPNKKYSPNVSAKSLMHLIQSPLLRSPVGKDNDGVETGSPRRRGRKPASDRSRRSLKLQN